MPLFLFHFWLLLPPFLFRHSFKHTAQGALSGDAFCLWKALQSSGDFSAFFKDTDYCCIFALSFTFSLFHFSSGIPTFSFCISLMNSFVAIFIILDSGSVLLAGEQLDSTDFTAVASAACLKKQKMPLGGSHAVKATFIYLYIHPAIHPFLTCLSLKVPWCLTVEYKSIETIREQSTKNSQLQTQITLKPSLPLKGQMKQICLWNATVRGWEDVTNLLRQGVPHP